MQTIKMKELQYTYYYWIHGIVDCQRVKEKSFPDGIFIFDLFEHEDAIIAASLCEASYSKR